MFSELVQPDVNFVERRPEHLHSSKLNALENFSNSLRHSES